MTGLKMHEKYGTAMNLRITAVVHAKDGGASSIARWSSLMTWDECWMRIGWTDRSGQVAVSTIGSS